MGCPSSACRFGCMFPQDCMRNSEARGNTPGHAMALQGHSPQGRGGPDTDNQAAPGSIKISVSETKEPGQ